MYLNLITINTVVEFVCFLAALIFLIRDKDAAWRLPVAYLLLTFATETFGLVLRKVYGLPNLQVYNVFLVIECLFISYFLYHIFKPYGYTIKWLWSWLGIFAVIYTSEILYHKFDDFVAITAAIMSITFVFACLWFYYLKLIDPKYEPLLSSAQFWWISGSLLFYFGSTACNIFFDYLIQNEYSTYDRSVRYVIFIVLNIVLYSFWSYSFICRYRQRRSSL